MKFRHAVQADVEEFHRALKLGTGATPEIRNPDLRVSLIMEEAVETCESISGERIEWEYTGEDTKQSLLDTIDGLCDILCVVYGTAVEFGVNIAPFWDEVHRTNMNKQGGPIRDDGKQLKPPDWKPPNLEPILNEQMKG